jgi:hypothetical protein
MRFKSLRIIETQLPPQTGLSEIFIEIARQNLLIDGDRISQLQQKPGCPFIGESVDDGVALSHAHNKPIW